MTKITTSLNAAGEIGYFPGSSEGKTRTSQRISTAAYCVMIFSWLFDFRSEGAGQGLAIQSFFLASYIGSSAIFFYATRAKSAWKGELKIFGYICAGYIFIACISGVAKSQDTYQIFRNGFTVVIYLTAAYATAKVVAFNTLHRTRKILTLAAFGYAISSFFIVLVFQGGVDLASVRYEIQGASSIAVLGLAITAASFRLKLVEMLAVASGLAIIALTVTRTYLLIFAAQLLLLLPIARRIFSIRLIMLGLSIIALGIIILIFDQGILERWIERIAPAQKIGIGDATFQTRISEIEFMIKAWLSSILSVLFGTGIAESTTWWIPLEVGGGQGGSIGFGHNQHISLLFTGGLFGGLPLLVIQTFQFIRSFKTSRIALHKRGSDPDLGFLLMWGSTIVLGTFILNFFASSFGNRGFSIWYGIGTGLVYGSILRTKIKNAQQTKFNSTNTQPININSPLTQTK